MSGRRTRGLSGTKYAVRPFNISGRIIGIRGAGGGDCSRSTFTRPVLDQWFGNTFLVDRFRIRFPPMTQLCDVMRRARDRVGFRRRH